MNLKVSIVIPFYNRAKLFKETFESIIQQSYQHFECLIVDDGSSPEEFEALNQGSSGPNTAELHVYDDKGLIISAKEWNLLTGRRAIITVIKE